MKHFGGFPALQPTVCGRPSLVVATLQFTENYVMVFKKTKCRKKKKNRKLAINKKRHNSESRWGSTPMLRLTLSTISSKPSERSSLMAFSNTTSPAKVMTRRWYWEAPMTSMMGSSGTILVLAMPSRRY